MAGILCIKKTIINSPEIRMEYKFFIDQFFVDETQIIVQH
jgi:hypothetical protein